MGRANFSGKVAFVTGASSGIGYATAVLLAQSGAHLVLASRNTPALEALADVIRKLGQDALVTTVDVTQQSQVEAAIQNTLSHWGRIDVLIANSGQYIRSPIAELTPTLIEKSMAVNFYGGVYAVLGVLPHMLANQRGHLALVTTMNAKKGLPPDAPYVAAKFALSGFGEVLRQELHGTGVYVTTVFPGRVDTPMIEYLTVPRISAKITPEAVAQAIVRGIELRRAEVILPPQARLLYYLNVFSPRLADWATRVLQLQGWLS